MSNRAVIQTIHGHLAQGAAELVNLDLTSASDREVAAIDDLLDAIRGFEATVARGLVTPVSVPPLNLAEAPGRPGR